MFLSERKLFNSRKKETISICINVRRVFVFNCKLIDIYPNVRLQCQCLLLTTYYSIIDLLLVSSLLKLARVTTFYLLSYVRIFYL